MEIPLEYHLLFLAMTFILFIITIFLLFIDVTLEKAVGATIIIMFNMILCIVVSLSFAAIDLYSWDSSGEVVHNVYSELYPFMYIYWAMFYVNFMLMVYAAYIMIRKPWESVFKDENQIFYRDSEW